MFRVWPRSPDLCKYLRLRAAEFVRRVRCHHDLGLLSLQVGLVRDLQAKGAWPFGIAWDSIPTTNRKNKPPTAQAGTRGKLSAFLALSACIDSNR